MPVITVFIRNTHRELNDEKIEDALEMLDLEWSKDEDTRTQCNHLNTSPLHRENVFNTNCVTGETADAVGSAFQTAGR